MLPASYAAARRLVAAALSEGSSEEEEEELDFGWQRVYEVGELAGFVSPEGIPCWTWEEVSFGMVGRGRD